jgi:hypothetical protein
MMKKRTGDRKPVDTNPSHTIYLTRMMSILEHSRYAGKSSCGNIQYQPKQKILNQMG